MLNPFNDISTKNKNKLLYMLEAKDFLFTKNMSINSKFANENILCIVNKGVIQIIKNNDNGTYNILEQYQENEVFLIKDKDDNNLDFIAIEDSKLIIIDYDYVITNLNNKKEYFNQFIKNLFIILNEKLNDSSIRIESLTKKTIRSKLLSYFNLEFKRRNSRHIYLPFNFKDLAEYLAIDRAAMSRELKYLKEDNLISIKGKRITLLYK